MAINHNVISGRIYGPGPQGEIIGGFDPNGIKTVKPLTFLGGTVLSFNATLGIGPLEESSLSLELLNDCKVESTPGEPLGDYFLGPGNIGSPVFFDLGEATTFHPTKPQYEQGLRDGEEYFKFGGILQSYTANQSSSGLTFSARVIDPRSLLAGVNIVLSSTLTGPVKHRNYYNVYAYYERGVLRPELRELQPEDGYLLAHSRGTDGPVPFYSGEIDQATDPSVDCSVFGAAHSNDQGMLYFKIKQALENMNLMCFSPNYGEEHDPELAGRDLTVATLEANMRHEKNVFKVDISELPDPPDAPLYFRIPGPNITLLDFISTVCESTGHIFHVELIESPPQDLHVIKIRVADIKDINNQDFKKEIITYNGKATDLTYGKELSTDNTRTLMVGEQKHQMIETVKLSPFFGEDKNGDPIIPISGSEEVDASGSTCGWSIEIDLDDLNYDLRCPLYDYSTTEEPDRDTQIVRRKVRLTEYHLRVAGSSLETWKKYVFNPWNPEDFSKVIRRNFPDLTTDFLHDIYSNLKKSQELTEELLAEPSDSSDSNSSTTGQGAPPEHTAEAAAMSMADQIANWNGRMMEALDARRSRSIEDVYNYISGISRTYYGKQYVAIISQHLCVNNPAYVDLAYVDSSGINVESSITIYNDPCSSGTDGTTVLNNKIWAPKQYSHTPTNDGAWIERCGSVLGLGSQSGEQIYLDFFRTDDGRVQPLARFDSQVVATLRGTETIIDDGPREGNGNLSVASIVGGLFESGSFKENASEDELGLLFASGVCGDLDTHNWSRDSFIKLNESGTCPPPTSGIDPIAGLDLPATVYSKCSVGEKIYLGSGCAEYTEIVRNRVAKEGINECCGKWQNWNDTAPCYTEMDILLEEQEEDCYEFEEIEVTKESCAVAYVPIIFSDGCFTKYCEDMELMESAAAEMEHLLAHATNSGIETSGGLSYDPYSGQLVTKGGVYIPTTPRFCYAPNPTGIAIIASALDFNSHNNQKILPTAFVPTAVAIPVRSNIETYGPWKSKNFQSSAGGVEVVQDTEFNPWVFDSVSAMNTFAREYMNDRAFNKSEIETGSVTIPIFPEKPLGFIENGPNLTNINVSVGSNGVTTTYSYRTYTPKFGGLKSLEKRALKDNISLIQKVRRLAREKQRKIDTINRRTGQGSNVDVSPKLNPGLKEQGTLQRILVGESYPFSIIVAPTGEGLPISSGWEIVSTGDRTVVGTETLQKSVVELTYNYRKKAFMSWDGLISPVANSRPSGADHHLPIYAHYSGGSGQSEASYNAPNPPVRVTSTDNQAESYKLNDLAINREYLDPLHNHFTSGEHHHPADGAGHNIDVVGRGSGAPDSGVIMNFYGQSKWDERYSDEYRFLGLRGPLVLHQWGYDTQGKPIPNAIDDENLIRQSGIFRTSRPSADPSGYPYIEGTGLSDYFMRDWLQKPSSWPVAPVDLRFDRKRGVWVSPPDYKIVVVEGVDAVEPYSSGEAFLVNSKDGREYSEKIYDKQGNVVETDKARVTVEDRIGSSFGGGEKSYAYFDSFTSTYLLMGGNPGIQIGKFCNQWPSLSNVKDPQNAVKDVVMYKTEACENTDCPWNLVPQTSLVSGVEVPRTVKVINLFSNVAAHEYQTKWCAFVKNGTSYFLLAAEC